MTQAWTVVYALNDQQATFTFRRNHAPTMAEARVAITRHLTKSLPIDTPLPDVHVVAIASEAR